MEFVKLQKRVVLSFETGKYEDGETDYTYIVDASCNPDKTLMAFTLSSGNVRIVRTDDFSNVSTITTKKNTIFSSHFVPFDSKFIVLCDQTGFIYVVNYETQETVVNFKVAKEIYSAALLCGGKMIVTGDKEHLYFNEVETGKQIGIYRDIHSDVINHICPHPVYPTVFASGSEDGLICVFDVARGNQEDSIVSVFQTDSGVANMGWFGGNVELIWCVSMTRGLSVWNSTTGDRLTEVTDFYPLHSEKGVEIDYLVGCISENNDLFVLGGDQDGMGYVIASSQPDQIVGRWKGHQSAIRCLIQIHDAIVTCGEDASFCVWSARSVGKSEKSAGVERNVTQSKKRSGKNAYKSV